MQYFVTGATGFLGGHLTVRLLELGHQVTALVPTRDEAREIAEYGIRPHVGTIVDKETMRRGMRGVDGVFHVAGSRVGYEDRGTAEAVNVIGTRNVLQLVRELSIPKAIHTSTLSVFSDTHGEVKNESYRFSGKHITAYDRMRARAHYEVALPLMQQGVPAVILMPGAMYGQNDSSVMAGILGRYLLDVLVASVCAYILLIILGIAVTTAMGGLGWVGGKAMGADLTSVFMAVPAALFGALVLVIPDPMLMMFHAASGPGWQFTIAGWLVGLTLLAVFSLMLSFILTYFSAAGVVNYHLLVDRERN